MMAPIVPHMAEDAWQNLPYKEKPNKQSVFDKGWITESERFPSFDAVKWDRIRLLRGDVNGCIGEKHGFQFSIFNIFIMLTLFCITFILLRTYLPSMIFFFY